MKRIDKERQKQLEPQRINFAIEELTKRNIEVFNVTSTSLQFNHKGHVITFFPFSGWHTGKTIKDGRGIKNLLKQL